MTAGGTRVDLLIAAGVPTAPARVLDYLLTVGASGSIELQVQAGLRQPEVSTGARWLIDQGWVKCKEMRTKGKGRPIHRYSMATTASAIDAHFERQIEERISRLDELSAEIREALVGVPDV